MFFLIIDVKSQCWRVPIYLLQVRYFFNLEGLLPFFIEKVALEVSIFHYFIVSQNYAPEPAPPLSDYLHQPI